MAQEGLVQLQSRLAASPALTPGSAGVNIAIIETPRISGAKSTAKARGSAGRAESWRGNRGRFVIVMPLMVRGQEEWPGRVSAGGN